MDLLTLPAFALEQHAEDILWDVVEQHLDEATFLWWQWERHLVAPAFSLSEVAERIEPRLLAHLQGLAVGGAPVAERLLLPLLDLEEEEVAGEPLRVSAGARALLEGWSEPAARAVFECFGQAGPTLRRALQRSLELCERQDVAARLMPLLIEYGADVQAAVLEVLAFRDEPSCDTLDAFLSSEEPAVVAGALRLAESCPSLAVKPEVLRKLLSRPELREPAIAVGLLRGHRESWDLCQQVLATREPDSGSLFVWMSLVGGRAEVQRLMDCLDNPKLRKDALWALGYSGWVEAADRCVELISDDWTGRVAAEAFCAITGLVLEDQFIREVSDAGQEEPIPLEEEDLDADLSLSPEDGLLIAEPDAVREWWRKTRSGFDAGIRYLGGRPLSGEVLVDALQTAAMRRRHVLARQLALGSRGMLRVNPRASTRRQLRQLTQAREVLASSGRALCKWRADAWSSYDHR
ncbi:TIGR02270 family protein [Archangium primigenium]|uniref:TIGR02270 family protein n=1 Tax=[Archangium] primigenium TaxID=2792470 RepID=UPI0019599698|nr:TIGR02270 family protein [Archangium primigenium]MBM7116340.1 TIGR02270 family protein [Archangium primigenium]